MAEVERISKSIGALLAALLVASCGENKKQVIFQPVAEIDQYKNIYTAPPSIKTAAASVVRISLSQGKGTGFFVSQDGVLITNSHVIGVEDCFKEGCFVDLGQHHEVRHSGDSEDGSENRVYIKPLLVDANLDLTVAQTYEALEKDGIWIKTDSKLSTPHFLALANDAETTQLIGKYVYTVGHPFGFLKKWTSGIILPSTNRTLVFDAMVVGGQSGSPVLNESGNVIGLVFGGNRCELTECISESGIGKYGLATSVGAIRKALQNAGINFRGESLWLTSGYQPNQSLTRLLSLNNQDESFIKVDEKSYTKRLEIANRLNLLESVKSLLPESGLSLNFDTFKKQFQKSHLKLTAQACLDWYEVISGKKSNSDEEKFVSPVDYQSAYAVCRSFLTLYSSFEDKTDLIDEQKFQEILNLADYFEELQLGYGFSFLHLALHASTKEIEQINQQIIKFEESRLTEPMNLAKAEVLIAHGNFNHKQKALDYSLNINNMPHSEIFPDMLLYIWNQAKEANIITERQFADKVMELLKSKKLSISQKLWLEQAIFVGNS